MPRCLILLGIVAMLLTAYQDQEMGAHGLTPEGAGISDSSGDVFSVPFAWGTPAASRPSDASLDAVLEDGLDRGLVGLALRVERDGEVLFDGAAGLLSREAGTPLTPSDRFRIYSVTKTFTAVLIMQLVDDGVLSLDDPVTGWLDDPVAARISNIDQITLRQLLTHTSGIYDYFDADSPFWQDAYLGEDADWSRIWRPEELLAYADGARHAPYFAPGEGVHYSNTGYILLGLVVEEASGQSFGDRLQQQILDPLGLADTVFAADDGVSAGRRGRRLPDDRRRAGQRQRHPSLRAVGRGRARLVDTRPGAVRRCPLRWRTRDGGVLK